MSESLPKKSRGPYRQSIRPSRQTRYNRRKRAERQMMVSGDLTSDSGPGVLSQEEMLPSALMYNEAEADTSTDYASGDYELTVEPVEGIIF